MTTKRIIGIAAALLLAPACGGGETTALEGIYEVQSWTLNEAGCEAEGASVLADQNETFFYLKTESFFGQEFVNLVFCASAEECSSLASDDSTINLGFGFEEGSDSSGWRGQGYTLGGSDTCSGEVRNNELTEVEEGSLRFRVERSFVEDVPLDGEGFCDEDAAIRQAESKGCESLEVVGASFVQGL
jgi:hypothetical protein